METVDLAIINGTIIDLETGDLLQQNIYISEGHILSISDPTSEEKRGATDTIDAKGKFILPGFWDNHVHFRGGDTLIEANKDFLKLFIANGITSVRDAGGDPGRGPARLQPVRALTEGAGGLRPHAQASHRRVAVGQ